MKKIHIFQNKIHKLKIGIHIKDYADGDKNKVMTLKREEFLRRFEQHFLLAYFTKSRHFGFLQNNGKHNRLQQI